ncbi:MAG TPA: hypothetical protein VL202_06680 [Pararhizobium sp.]|uniref:hypothetical protein n=1 Tax=Pararhizobium sp. TaxID=1977563 RepID=UPI002BB7282B|nr:hypothetical protein [Pararhizobium sp.]HTO30844.1 hypothetical protein [Pararhizobium sp.]
MSDLDFDPALFGLWPKAAAYDGVRPGEGAALQDVARRVILETKAEAVAPLDDLQDMLNGMTKELREQMQQFQRLRRLADETAAVEGQEIDRKLVQADAKAAIEAMSVIVRTLEKIDSLQRTIAHDRQAQADAAFDEAGYKALLAEFEQRIEDRAARKAAGAASDVGRDGHASSLGGGGGGKAGEPRGSPED